MTPTIWSRIAETPWWVYLIYLYIFLLGVTASKPRLVSFNQITFFPIVFLLFSIFLFVKFSEPSLHNLFYWIAPASLGIFLGWFHFRIHRITFLDTEKKFLIPGSWNMLIIIIGVLIAKYGFGYAFENLPAYLQKAKHQTFLIASYGMMTGLLFGRAVYAIRNIN